MSLINNMLRKLDERQNAAAGGAPAAAAGLAVPLESARAGRSPLIVVGLVLLGVAAMGVTYWYLKPEPARVPAPIVIEAPTTAIAASLPMAEPPSQLASQPVAETMPPSAAADVMAQASAPLAVSSAAASAVPVATSPTQALAAEKTAPSTLAPVAPSAPSAASQPVPATAQRYAAVVRPAQAVPPAPRRAAARPPLQTVPLAAMPPAVVPAVGSVPVASPVQASAPVASSIHVERAPPTQRETHQISVQRAMTLQQRGQNSEAETVLRQVLDEDRAMHPARSALASLLARTLREDEAHRLLEEGLAQHPGQPLLTMQYARMLASRNAWRTAADVLSRGGENLGRDPEYHALYGAVLQRLGRFDVSVTAYQRALQLAGGVGTWWVGMAVSLESLGRPAEAREAYLQARARGGLSADVAQFVESKLR